MTERFQRLQERLERRHATWFIGAALLVALATFWRP